MEGVLPSKLTLGIDNDGKERSNPLFIGLRLLRRFDVFRGG
jgi:hypothetical protein